MLRGHDTFKRKCTRVALTVFSPLLVMGIILLGTNAALSGNSQDEYGTDDNNAPNASLANPGGMLVGLGSLILIPAPILIKWLYMGKVWDAQPWFIGMEGHMSLPDIERYLFGTKVGRLSWSTTGSPLSRHNLLNKEQYPEYPDYCEGQDPISDGGVRNKINDLRDKKRIFTLVDTYTMTVTLFSARNPPWLLLLAGVKVACRGHCYAHGTGPITRSIGRQYSGWRPGPTGG